MNIKRVKSNIPESLRLLECYFIIVEIGFALLICIIPKSILSEPRRDYLRYRFFFGIFRFVQMRPPELLSIVSLIIFERACKDDRSVLKTNCAVISRQQMILNKMRRRLLIDYINAVGFIL